MVKAQRVYTCKASHLCGSLPLLDWKIGVPDKALGMVSPRICRR